MARMHRASHILVTATALAACLTLCGCNLIGEAARSVAQVGRDTAQNVSGASEDLSNDLASLQDDFAGLPDGIASSLSQLDESSYTRVIVLDAATGETVAETSDLTLINQAFAGFSGAWDLAGESDVAAAGPAAYIIELWQRETVQLGENPQDVGEFRVCSVTTYRDSERVVRFEVLDGGLIGFDLIAQEDGAATPLKELAEAAAR